MFGIFSERRSDAWPCDRVLFLEYEARAKLPGAEQGQPDGSPAWPGTAGEEITSALLSGSHGRGRGGEYLINTFP